MICFICDKEMDEIVTDFNSKWGNYELIIKGVKAHKCNTCKRLVFDSDEATMIQNITAGLAESQNPEKPDLLNLSEVADILRVSNQTVYNMIRDGRINAIKVGREWRFNREQINSLLNNQNKFSLAARGSCIPESDIDLITKELGINPKGG